MLRLSGGFLAPLVRQVAGTERRARVSALVVSASTLYVAETTPDCVVVCTASPGLSRVQMTLEIVSNFSEVIFAASRGA